MALYVQKFGGTSVGSVERIHAVAERVTRSRAEGHDVVVVVSAMSGETNRLTSLGREVARARSRKNSMFPLGPELKGRRSTAFASW